MDRQQKRKGHQEYTEKMLVEKCGYSRKRDDRGRSGAFGSTAAFLCDILGRGLWKGGKQILKETTGIPAGIQCMRGPSILRMTDRKELL